MTGLALRGLGERKLRSVLTAIAVLLGVAMIAGTYVLTDQMRGGFAELNRSVYGGVDVEVAPKEAFSSQFSAAKPLTRGLDRRGPRRPGCRPGGGRAVGIRSARSRRRAQEVHRRRRHDHHHRVERALQGCLERRRPNAGTLRRGGPVPRHGGEAPPRAGRLPRHRDPRRHGAGDGGRYVRPRERERGRHGRGFGPAARHSALVRPARRGDDDQCRRRGRPRARGARPACTGRAAGQPRGPHRHRGG